MDELQEMHEQMATLKEKLNKQKIVTEQNLRKVVNQKMHSWRVSLIMSCLAVPALVLLTYYYDSGTMFQPIAWAIIGAAIIFFNIQSMLLLKRQDIMSGNLREVLPKLHQIRKRERGALSYFFAAALPIIIFGDGLIKICQKGHPFGKWHLLFIVTGLIFTALYLLGYKFIALKRPSQWDEYIRQLEEIAELDEENQEEENPTCSNSQTIE